MDQENKLNDSINSLSKKQKRKSLSRNYIYNLVYQIFLLVSSLAITPYIARVLGEDGSGKYSFSYSILTYFTLVAALGFSTYAQREIAKRNNNRSEQSILFWEIFIARLIPVFFSILVYFILIFLGIYEAEYRILMIIMSLDIITVAFDISFLFQGKEEFGKIIFSYSLIKLLGITSILIFVKSRNDLDIYTLIQSLTILFTSLTLWIFLPKELEKVPMKEIKPFKHFLPTIILFLPTIATAIYTSIDKTLIGVLVPGTYEQILENGEIIEKKISDYENGNYEYAEKIIKMALTVITSLGMVMIPRNTQKFAEGNSNEVKSNIYITAKITFLLGIPIMLGCIIISDLLIPWYLGSGYDKAANLMKILSPIILFIGFSNVFGLQFLIPTGQDKKYTISILLGTIMNICLNLILIPSLKSYGAAISTIIAEFFVTFIMYWFIRKDIKISKVFFNSWKVFLAGGIMFIPCYFMSQNISETILNTFLIIAMGIGIYGITLILLKEEFVLIVLKKIFIIIKKLF